MPPPPGSPPGHRSLFSAGTRQALLESTILPLASSLEGREVSLAHCCGHYTNTILAPPEAPGPDKDSDAQTQHSLEVSQPGLAELCPELGPPDSCPATSSLLRRPP